MFTKTNIEERLLKLRQKRIPSDKFLSEVHQIFAVNEKERDLIKEQLSSHSKVISNRFNLDLLASEKIFHRDEIKKLCVDYRLRFLSAGYFKGEFPEEAISKIRALEKTHQISLGGLKVMAPAKLLKLENADDPLLFAPMGNDYYYFIHKWGDDLHPFRKMLMWPYRNFENLVFTVFILSIFLTSMMPMQVFTKGEVGNQEYLLLFLFIFKAVCGIVLYYGFAKGKNFNTAIWDSKYYNG